MTAQQALNDIIEPVVTGMGYEYVGCEMLSQGKYSLLRIYIDKDSGINVDDCATVSGQLSAVLDVEDPVKTQYKLEVSSPGLDRPLFTLPQFERYIGQDVKVRLKVPVENRGRFTGVLTSVDGENIVLQVESEAVTLSFSNVAKANLIYRFDK